jgi:hypothetical protein
MRRWRYVLLGLNLLVSIADLVSIWHPEDYVGGSASRPWAVGLSQGRVGAGFRGLTPQTPRSPRHGLRVQEFPPLVRWRFDWSYRPGSLLVVAPVWPALLALGGLSFAAFRARADPPTACPRCGYELAMASGPRCPECGAERGA